jgi:hypothetical protein
MTTCCIETPCISGADLAEARPEQLGAALGAIARRSQRDSMHADGMDASAELHDGSASALSVTKMNLAL